MRLSGLLALSAVMAGGRMPSGAGWQKGLADNTDSALAERARNTGSARHGSPEQIEERMIAATVRRAQRRAKRAGVTNV